MFGQGRKLGENSRPRRWFELWRVVGERRGKDRRQEGCKEQGVLRSEQDLGQSTD